MAGTYKYQMSVYECQKVIRQNEITKIRQKRILATLLCNEISLQTARNRNYSKKRFWVHPIFKLRDKHGFFGVVFPTLSSYSDKFENYFRMSAMQFEELLCLIGPHICKKNVVRETISTPARVALTLR